MALSTDNQNDQALEILDQVTLDHFSANPTSIGPFGASNLSWKATGPAGFHLELNGSLVPKTGQRTVQPINTATFTLTAVAFQAWQVTGSVTVQVVTSGCKSSGIVNPRSTIEAPLRANVNNSSGTSFRGGNDLIVTFSPGRIRFQMKLSKSVNDFPDPDVDTDVSFGLTVQDGLLVPVSEQISVDISVPWWAWLIPGTLIPVSIALDMGRDDARKKMHEAVLGLVQLLNIFATFPDGLQLYTVRIDKDETGNNGIIEFTACPNKLLVDFANISGAVIIQ
jgi:hypothetical protein